MQKKVLIVHATGGMGHVKAAKAIEEVFKTKYPEVRVLNIDVIDHAFELYRKFFVDGYNYISARQPKLWGKLYQWFNKKSSQTFPNMISRIAIEGRFIPFVKEFNPDFIIATHPLPMVLVSASKKKEVIDIPSSIVLTDFGYHSYWVDQHVNYYFTSTDDVKRGLIGFGVAPSNVITTGIPIEPKFTMPVDRAKVFSTLGLQPDLFTFLIVGGQISLEDLQMVMRGIKHKTDRVQFIVVTGRDKYLKEELDKSDSDELKTLKVLGFVDTMHELMSVADLIFSKAGGLTVSECMAKGLPMVIHKVIPGQEEDNVNFLVRKGAAIKADDMPAIVRTVLDLSTNRKKLDEMKKACQEIGKPHSAQTLVDFVYNQLK